MLIGHRQRPTVWRVCVINKLSSGASKEEGTSRFAPSCASACNWPSTHGGAVLTDVRLEALRDRLLSRQACAGGVDPLIAGPIAAN
jgi:hypothetical protein